MIHCTISHRGVPIGRVDVGAVAGTVTVEFAPLSAFDAWRQLAEEVGRALSAAGFFGRGGMQRSGLSVGERSAKLDEGASWGRELELRDRRGELVPTTFIEIAQVPDEAPPLYVAWIGFQAAAAGVPAAKLQPERSATESA